MEVELPNPKPRSGLLVKSHAAWQKEMAKWVQGEQVRSDYLDDDDLGGVTYRHQRSKWLPRSLELLFGGLVDEELDEEMMGN